MKAAAALDALNRYEDQARQPGNDDDASLEELKVALRRELERRGVDVRAAIQPSTTVLVLVALTCGAGR